MVQGSEAQLSDAIALCCERIVVNFSSFVALATAFMELGICCLGPRSGVDFLG